ncbi:Immediate early response 3-interacting protein 1 [Blattella germanica]|nr:Immediate early response 3-interacting protein 1 [Blattella germanica]
MAFTLWNLFEATLLCLNAVCILHEERFLAKMGWGANQNIQGFGEQPTIKSQILNLVRSIRTVTRIPLIFLNILTIVIKLILG